MFASLPGQQSMRVTSDGLNVSTDRQLHPSIFFIAMHGAWGCEITALLAGWIMPAVAGER